MFVPEVEIVSYKETASLSEKTEGEFHVIVRQTSKTQYVRVGDPLTLGISAGGDLIKGIFNVLGGGNSGENMDVE